MTPPADDTTRRLKRRLTSAECWIAALAAMMADPPKARLWVPLPAVLLSAEARAGLNGAAWWWCGIPLPWQRRPTYAELKATWKKNIDDVQAAQMTAALKGRL